MSVEIVPVEGLPEIAEGDDIAALITSSQAGRDLRDGDVVAVTQKIVSKSEGRIVPDAEGRGKWVERETVRVVASRGDLLIAETAHGLVCANAGVDASNIPAGFLSLLPEDPDGSAERIRAGLGRATGADIGVVVTDTFGRPWRRGLVNVAIGCAGIPSLVDMRGGSDREGRTLETTIVAFADEIAAASGLVMPKAGGIPAAIVRGLITDAPPGRAAEMVRPPEEDLFREAPLTSISSRRTVRAFGPGDVPRGVIEEAIRAACTAPAPHHNRPWLFTVADSPSARHRLLAAMAGAWRRDLASDGVPRDAIEKRLAASDAVLGGAPVLIVPAVRFSGSHEYPDAERAEAERQMFLLSGGAGVQNLLLALHAQGVASCWISSTLFCKEETIEALGLGDEWIPIGAVAAGTPPPGSPQPRPQLNLEQHLLTI